jgi:hypothetical protein
MITADGYEPLITARYIAGDSYIESDAVFGAKQSLTVGYHKSRAANGRGDGAPDLIDFDFTLAPAAGERRPRQLKPAARTARSVTRPRQSRRRLRSR